MGCLFFCSSSYVLSSGAPNVEEFAPGDNSLIDVRKDIFSNAAPFRPLLRRLCAEGQGKGTSEESLRWRKQHLPLTLRIGTEPPQHSSDDVDATIWQCLRASEGAQFLTIEVAEALAATEKKPESAANNAHETATTVVSFSPTSSSLSSPSSSPTSSTDFSSAPSRPAESDERKKARRKLGAEFRLLPSDAASLMLYLSEQPALYDLYLQWKRQPLRSQFVANHDYLCPYLSEERPLWQCRVCTAALLKAQD